MTTAEDRDLWERDEEAIRQQTAPSPHGGSSGGSDLLDPERRARYAEALYDGGSVRCGVCGFTRWRECLLCADWCEAAARDAIRLADSELSPVVAANERLRRWKGEASEVILGLQDLGKALGIPLGERITGPMATEAANRLTARAESAESALAVARAQVEAVRSALAEVEQQCRLFAMSGNVMVPAVRAAVARGLSSAAADTPEPASPDTASEGGE